MLYSKITRVFRNLQISKCNKNPGNYIKYLFAGID